MSADTVCFAVMAGGIAAAAGALVRFRPGRETVVAAAVVGLAVALLNMGIESASVRLDLYYVTGPWLLGDTPVPLTLGWATMTFALCLLYRAVVKRGRAAAARAAMPILGVAVGFVTDMVVFRGAGVMRLGDNGSFWIILAVWILFVPGTLFGFEALRGIIARGGAGE